MNAIGLLRVDKRGRIVECNDIARDLLGPCEGHGCSPVINARNRDRSSPCADCVATNRSFATRDRGVVQVRGDATRISCSRVGDETIVVLEPTGLRGLPAKLTPRERDVLRLVAQGHETARIAQKLKVRQSTIRTHVENAREKLGASTRAQAVAIALKSGQIC